MVIVIIPFISILTREQPIELESEPKLPRDRVFLLREPLEVLVISNLVMFDRGAFVQKMKGGVINTPLCRGFIIRHCSSTMKNFDKVKYTFYFHDK